MNRINFSAKTLDEAITKACIELGVTSDMLDYKVLEQGSAGILGIGARPWIITACNKAELEAEEAELAKKEKAEREAALKKAEQEKAEQLKAEKAAEAVKKAAVKQEIRQEVKQEIKQEAKAEKMPESAPKQEAAVMKDAATKEAGIAAAQKAEEFLRNVFESIGMEVAIKSNFDEMLSELNIELSGDDMGVLIGKRGQTLDSLQYLIGQIINKHGSGYIRVKLDTENYRQRRQETLENLAHNMAARVRRTHHAMALEPMNPYERRIIHSALQDEKDVTTRSEGEEPYRHVVVCFIKHRK